MSGQVPFYRERYAGYNSAVKDPIAILSAAGDLFALFDPQDKTTMDKPAGGNPSADGDTIATMRDKNGDANRTLTIGAGTEPIYKWDATRKRWYLSSPQAGPAKALRSAANVTLGAADVVYHMCVCAREGINNSGIITALSTNANNGIITSNSNSSFFWLLLNFIVTGQAAKDGRLPAASVSLNTPVVIEQMITPTEYYVAINGSDWIAPVGGAAHAYNLALIANARIGMFTATGTPSGADGRRIYYDLWATRDMRLAANAALRRRLVNHGMAKGGMLQMRRHPRALFLPTIGASNWAAQGNHTLSTVPRWGSGLFYHDATNMIDLGGFTQPKDPLRGSNDSAANMGNTGSPIPAFVDAWDDAGLNTLLLMSSGAKGSAGITTGGGSANWSESGTLLPLEALKFAHGVRRRELDKPDGELLLPGIGIGSGAEADALAGVTEGVFIPGAESILDRWKTLCLAAFTADDGAGGTWCSQASIDQIEDFEAYWFQIEPTASNNYATIIGAIDTLTSTVAGHNLICDVLDLLGLGHFNGDNIHHNQPGLELRGAEGGTNFAALMAARYAL